MVQAVSTVQNQGWNLRSYLPALPSRKLAAHVLYRANQVALPVAMIVFMMQVEGVEGKSKCIRECKKENFQGDNNVFTNTACGIICAIPGAKAAVMAARTILDLWKIIKAFKG